MTTSVKPVSDLGLSRYVHEGRDDSFTFEVAVKGAHCANCIAKIEGGVRKIPDVTRARLNLSTGKLSVSWSGKAVKPEAIVTCVRALGYQAEPFDAASTLEESSEAGALLLRCFLVAGVATVFVMGLTDAIWYGGDMSAATRNAFFWLAGVIAVPATLFASLPFFGSAFRSLSKRRVNMDVPISLAVILSLALSVYETLAHAETTYFDAALMLVFVLLIGRYLDFYLRDRARSAARGLLAMQATPVRRINAEGHTETVLPRDLHVGESIALATGERTPVDGVVEDQDTDADLSLVTGESVPVKIAKGSSLLAGSIIVGRPVIFRVRAGVENSLVADLARLLEAGQQARSLYVRLADRATRAYVPFVFGLSTLVLIGWLVAGAPISVAVTNAITILIITCPCALGLAVPAVQIVATGRLFDRGIFVKSGDALERLAEIDTAVFDKTGTLTLGMPVLTNRDSISPDILEAAARLARASRHPLARAVARAAGDGPIAAGVAETAGSGIAGELNGVQLRLGKAAWCGAQAQSETGELWYRQGEADPVRLAFHDAIRPDARETVAALAERHIAVEMLTGDRAAPAAQMAAQAGIANWQAGVGPNEKAERMASLSATGHRALMVGDGINDAGALALAHVSIAPGTAADISQRASDLVLRSNSLSLIVEAVDVARKARRLILENFAFAALYNISAIPLAIFGVVSPLIAAAAMAGSSMIVTLNALRLMAGRVR